MSIGKLHSELDALEQAAKDAYAAHLKARERQRRAHHHAARDVVSDLAALRDSILYRKPDAPEIEDRPARERDLTVEFCKAIIEREDLVFFPLGNSDNLAVRDLSIDRDAAASNLASVAARKRLRDYEDTNREGLKAEKDHAAMEKVRDAIASDDPEKLAEVLALTGKE